MLGEGLRCLSLGTPACGHAGQRGDMTKSESWAIPGSPVFGVVFVQRLLLREQL